MVYPGKITKISGSTVPNFWSDEFKAAFYRSDIDGPTTKKSSNSKSPIFVFMIFLCFGVESIL